MIASVDYLGIIGILAPLALALFGVAYRMGTMNENMRNMRNDMKDMQSDIKQIQTTLVMLPKRKRDVEED